MRIAVVSDVIYPWVKGGAELRYYELYRRIAKHHEVHYFTMRFPEMKKTFSHKGMIVHAISTAPESLYAGSRRRILPALKFSFFLFFALMKYKFDAIDSNEFPYFPNIAVRLYVFLNRTSLFVSTWLEHWPIQYWRHYLGGLSGIIGYAIQMLSLRMPHRFVAISNHTRNDLLTFTNIPKERIHVVWCGIDRDSINAVNEQNIQREQYKIVFVGRLIPEKRVDLLIKLVELLRYSQPKIRLAVIGDGPEMDTLRELGEDIGVQFLGRIPEHKDLLREVASASVYVSLSEREGFNISALEACELGLPSFVRVVCFDHPNLHQLRVQNIMKIVQLANESSELAIANVEDFSWDRLAAQMESLLIP